MAALYLHQALFANDSLPTPVQAHRSSRGPHDYPTLSAVTLRTSTSEHSHPTEPLLHGPYPQDSAFQDILSSQPVYSESSRTSWNTGLSLSGDPLTPLERKSHRERLVRRKLRRLRWARRVLRGIIGEMSAVVPALRMAVLTVVVSSCLGRVHHNTILCRLCALSR